MNKSLADLFRDLRNLLDDNSNLFDIIEEVERGYSEDPTASIPSKLRELRVSCEKLHELVRFKYGHSFIDHNKRFSDIVKSPKKSVAEMALVDSVKSILSTSEYQSALNSSMRVIEVVSVVKRVVGKRVESLKRKHHLEGFDVDKNYREKSSLPLVCQLFSIASDLVKILDVTKEVQNSIGLGEKKLNKGAGMRM